MRFSLHPSSSVIKTLVAGVLFAVLFLISVGAITYLPEPLPEGVRTPAFYTVQQGDSVCIVAYASRGLVITLTPEVIAVSMVLGALFGFNTSAILRLRRERKPTGGYVIILTAGAVLAMLSSSTCWLACCNGGILLTIITNKLPAETLSALMPYTGFAAIPAVILLLANLIKIGK